MTAPITLALDAATYDGSVAIVRGGDVLAEATVAMRGTGVERLMPAVAQALGDAGVEPRDLARVVCGAGPGSFTSLRIAASIAKGVASGRGIPLHAVSSLLLVVAGSRWGGEPGRYLALLPAMRGELFAAGFEVGERGAIVPVVDPVLLRADEADAAAAQLRARRIGPAEPLAAAPHARGVALLAGYADTIPVVDLAAWEPNYGRLAEAQARWEAAHGRPLPAL